MACADVIAVPGGLHGVQIVPLLGWLFARENLLKQPPPLPDESPRLELFTSEQLQQKETWLADVSRLEKDVATASPAVLESLAKWDTAFPRSLAWKPLKPASGKSDGGVTLSVADDGTVRADKGASKATYSIEVPLNGGKLNAVRLDTLPDDALPGNRHQPAAQRLDLLQPLDARSDWHVGQLQRAFEGAVRAGKGGHLVRVGGFQRADGDGVVVSLVGRVHGALLVEMMDTPI